MSTAADWAALDPRPRVKAIVLAYEGCSLSHDRERLARLIGHDFDETEEPDCDPDYGAKAVTLRTNCATFALGVLAAACLHPDLARKLHPLLMTPTAIGQAFSRLVTIGRQTGALVSYSRTGEQPKMGDILWYRMSGNDDHAEVCLADVGSLFIALHGGAGRADNAVTIGTSDIRWSLGRPLHAFISLDRLKLPEKLVRPPTDEEVAWMTSLRAEQDRLNATTAGRPPSPLEKRETLPPPEE